jgi:hypothetical protein
MIPKLDVVVVSDASKVGVGVIVSVGRGALVDISSVDPSLSGMGEDVPVSGEHELRPMVNKSREAK